MSNELSKRVLSLVTFNTNPCEIQRGMWREKAVRVQGDLALSTCMEITDNQFNERTAIAAKKIIMLRIKLALYSEVVDALVSIRYALRDNSVDAADTMVRELIRYIDDIKYTGD